MSVARRVRQKSFQSSAQEAVVALLVAAGRALRELEETCQRHGITHEQYNVLRILRGAHPDGHPRYEIAQRLMDRAPDVTRRLDRLERQGLVVRDHSERDRRLSISRITPGGLELLARMESEILAVHERVAAPLDEADRRQLAALCGQLVD
jgi:DNA-binding MarR family transcriptional regulator